MRGRVLFTNRHGEKFDLGRCDLAELEVREQEEIILMDPGELAEDPDIETEDTYYSVIEPKDEQHDVPMQNQIDYAAREN